MDGAGKCAPPHFAETQVHGGSKLFSRPMLPALIVLAPEPRQREACFNAKFCNEVLDYIIMLPAHIEARNYCKVFYGFQLRNT